MFSISPISIADTFALLFRLLICNPDLLIYAISSRMFHNLLDIKLYAVSTPTYWKILALRLKRMEMGLIPRERTITNGRLCQRVHTNSSRCESHAIFKIVALSI